MPRIRIARLPHGYGIDLPAYETRGAAGFDLRAAVPFDAPVTIPPGGRALIPTGFAFEIDRGYEVQIRPRSGLALKHGVTVANSPGTVDADYRGEVGVILINLGDADFVVENGARIAQGVLAAAPQADFEEVEDVDSLEDTARGAGGFGSTGVR